MIAEAIKTALGSELAAQVEEALKGKGKDGKDFDIVVGNDGTYVPAHKYETEKSRAENAEKALKSAADELKNIGGSGDTAKIAEDLKKAQEDITKLQDDHKAEIAKLHKNNAVKAALAGKVHDPADILALLEMDKIEVDDNGTLKTDLEGMLKPIKESKAYLFKDEGAGGTQVTGAKPAGAGKGEPAARVTGPVVM